MRSGKQEKTKKSKKGYAQKQCFFVTIRAGTAYRKIWRLVNNFFARIIRFTVQKFQLFWVIFCIIIIFIELWHILILWLAKMPNGACRFLHWLPPDDGTGKYSFTKKHCSEVSVNSPGNLWSQSGRRKGRLRWEGFAEKIQLHCIVQQFTNRDLLRELRVSCPVKGHSRSAWMDDQVTRGPHRRVRGSRDLHWEPPPRREGAPGVGSCQLNHAPTRRLRFPPGRAGYYR